ncbi:hypothetical protein [Mucilaginibacter sp. L3T2-6]|uniref:hypothetical protein n=1 Tax=Mucilaginibacter sp. L3T2-6 TaxID=3062491 RepID=UPI002674744D|nr:hypothetical protein [Mucilaginibacter sp. L3T2-6]MDO3640386.1 hypothetical protein [Mucilaginibacter sp. L3T2-6]MDV6213275.1 hypothetical protein [Mucilaginibacter sp. L3T2-6]
MESIALFHTFINAYRQIGPFELHPVKTREALLINMRFCTVNKIGRDYTDAFCPGATI